MEREDPDSGLGAAVAFCAPAREPLCLPESPFSVREVGEDRVASRVLSSSLVSDGLTPQQPHPHTQGGDFGRAHREAIGGCA